MSISAGTVNKAGKVYRVRSGSIYFVEGLHFMGSAKMPQNNSPALCPPGDAVPGLRPACWGSSIGPVQEADNKTPCAMPAILAGAPANFRKIELLAANHSSILRGHLHGGKLLCLVSNALSGNALVASPTAKVNNSYFVVSTGFTTFRCHCGPYQTIPTR